MDCPLNRRRCQLSLLLLSLIFGAACPEIHAVWFPFGPDGGDARAFADDPSNHLHLYLGTTNGWIYQSQDGGKKWARLASVGKRDDLVLDNILIDPQNPKHIVVGAWNVSDLRRPGGGIYISNDGGTTWADQPEMRDQSILALTVAPSDGKTMVAGSMDGVFRSTDSGEHWQPISPKGSTEIHEVESLAVDPRDPKTIYAGTWHLPWKTTDGGAHWTSIKQGIIDDSDVFSIIVDPKQANVVYASACSGIYKSDDGGAKFAKAPGIPSSARRTRVLMQDPNHLDTVFAGTTEGLYRTDDGGKVWTETTGSDLIVNDVYVDPTDSRRVLLATDRSGVLLSDDGGTSFSPSNSGFSARHITAYTGDVRHPATVYVGVVNDKQWGGVFVSHTGGLSWSQLNAGLDGRDVFSLGQAPDGTIVAGTGHGIYRLKDTLWERAGSAGTAPAAAGKPPVAGKVGPRGSKQAAAKQTTSKGRVAAKGRGAGVAVKNFDGSVYGFAVAGETLFAATSGGLLRSASSGLTWNAAPAIPMDEYRFLAAAKSNVAAASLDAIEMSADGGVTWQAVALPPKVTQILALAVDGQGGMWVAGRDGVFYSANKGRVWQAVNGLDVPNANSIFYDEAANRVLVTAGGMVTEAFAVQLPAMQVIKWDTGWNLRFLRPVGNYLVAGTMFDGIVVQPRMVESPVAGETTAQR